MLVLGWTLNYEMFFYFTIWLSMIIYRKLFITITTIIITASYLFATNTEIPLIHDFFGNKIIFEFIFGLFLFKIYTLKVLKLSSASLLLIASLSYFLMATIEKNTDVIRLLKFGLPSFIFVMCVINLESSIDRKINL